MTDPQPEFVSLVRAGANMTPFLAVKADKGTPATKGEGAAPVAESTETVVVKQEGFEVSEFQFDPAHFAKKSEVEAWLKDGGYVDFKIEEVDGSFVVKAEGLIFEGELSEVTAATGVKAKVGKVAAGAVDEDEQQHGDDRLP